MLTSLIWKNKKETSAIDGENFKSIINDIKLNKILPLMSREPDIKMTSDIFLSSLTNDKENIEFRNCILGNFANRGNMIPLLAELIVLIDKMRDLHKIIKSELRVPALMLRLKKLEIYNSVMEKLEEAFPTDEKPGVADGFSSISEDIKAMIKTRNIENLGVDVKKIKELLSKIQSIDIGANVDDHDLREAIILSLNSFKYEKSDIIAKLNSRDSDDYHKKSIASEIDVRSAGQLLIFENEVYRDFEVLLNRELAKITGILGKYEDILTSEILVYRDELCLYFGALKLREYLLNNGCGLCFPETGESTNLSGMYSIHMLVEKNSTTQSDRYKVVKNTLFLSDNERVLLITGPNNGGKTVLLETLALIQLLYQNGMFIPAAKATLPVYKKIFTHFPKDEDIGKGAGRLGEEAGRVRDILRGISGKNLVIFNEPYITTSPLEGRDILANTIKKFEEKGLAMYLVTHYLDILDELDDTGGVASYVMEIVDGNKTFIARKMLPMADSQAMEVARSHGVDYDGIMKIIKMRESREVSK